MPFIDIQSIPAQEVVPGCRLRTPYGKNLMLSYLEMDAGAEIPLHDHPHEDIDGDDGGTGAAYNVSMDSMGHPIASNIRECYLDLVAQGKQNELPLIAAGGVGKKGNLAANAASLFMLGASCVSIGKYIMQAAAQCFGDEYNRCNVCNLGKCPRGICY